tara:strand:- start:213 stop:569 length:357 start_codon:yes stop_codon:yes gene_type:complete
MAKAYIFKVRNANRFRKIYNYIRKKPINQYYSDDPFTMVVGDVTFTASSGPVTFTYTTADPTLNFTNVPVVTAISVDSIPNNSANVNVFVTSVTTTAVQFEASAPFTGKVNFQIISQD